MRHLRSDYDAIQPWPIKRPHIAKVDGETVDTQNSLHHLGKHMDPIIPDDEPVFLIRGADPVARTVLQWWADATEALGGDAALCERVREWGKEMDAYRLERYPDKVVADTPADLLR